MKCTRCREHLKRDAPRAWRGRMHVACADAALKEVGEYYITKFRPHDLLNWDFASPSAVAALLYIVEQQCPALVQDLRSGELPQA